MATYIGKQLKFTDANGNIFKLIPVDTTEKGAANGVAQLDENGKVPSYQLPAYVDDVLEFNTHSFSDWTEWVSGEDYMVGNRVKVTTVENETTTVVGYICKVDNNSSTILDTEWEEATAFPAEGESGKIYIALDTNLTYRWSGSVYVSIASDLALGETSNTAYRGDYGAAAYAAAVTNVDEAVTEDSTNLITSGAVYEATLSGAKVITVETTVTNTSGAYSANVVDSRITSIMKPITLELGNPDAFDDDIMVTCSNGYLTISCTSVSGTSTMKIGVISSATTSQEYDVIDTNKADKVLSAVSGHLAALDQNGNLTDSGIHLSVVDGKICITYKKEVEE